MYINSVLINNIKEPIYNGHNTQPKLRYQFCIERNEENDISSRKTYWKKRRNSE